MINTMPSINFRYNSDIPTPATKLTAKSTGNSRRKMFESTLSGAINAVTPSTNAMLAIFDPIALPIARPGLFAKLAVTETNISGADDPIATMVKPTISGGTPMFLANAEAPSVNRSALHTSRAIPMKINAKSNSMNTFPINS